uniref:aminotransferase class I/II-fold pyridoxal phosphate-dependent enzyme n=1 Tax=Eggerthella sinensis TaxID=242230 RepID=UPI0022E50FFC
MTSGVQNALVITLCALFRAGDRIAVDAYTFPNFIELAKLLGIELVPIAGDAEGMRADALDAVCRSVSVRGVYLMPTCANPTT